MRKRLKKKKNVASNEHRSNKKLRGRQIEKASRLAKSATRATTATSTKTTSTKTTVHQKSIFEKLSQDASQLAQIADTVNSRVTALYNNGLNSYALQKLTNGDEFFYATFDDVTSEYEAIERLTQYRTFISDSGSTVDGAKLQLAELKSSEYKGLFGNQWRTKENNWHSYAPSIDSELLQEAGKVFRRIEDSRAMEIYNAGGYGSESFFSLIYSYMVQYGDADMAHISAWEVLDAFDREKNPMNRQNDLERAQTDNITSLANVEIDNITGRKNF